ncbi:SRPBCC family protein [Streptomyces asoensis]|uniref:SRPBCC family protein n=1 Tax=Streptomyces asoensis TaxID=249586 RepID=A0A6M4X1I2_9ACTN|nr:SRPBCC family protein [Streptomyces asoensis]QJT06109.1 SRPBCC family protein [Streptomyces asoensis]
MAVRHQLVKASPQAVWDVLADGDRYAEWVVGTSSTREMTGEWPHVDAKIAYAVRVGPVSLANETVVRRCEEPDVLELEARAGVLGTARIAFELRPWGRHCLVILDEHPLQGVGGLLHNAGVEVVTQIRHRALLGRLAKVCESEARGGRSDGPRRTPAAARAHAEGGADA